MFSNLKNFNNATKSLKSNIMLPNRLNYLKYYKIYEILTKKHIFEKKLAKYYNNIYEKYIQM